MNTQTNQELRDQLSYWEIEMDRYDNSGDPKAYERARGMFTGIKCELIERTQGDEPLDLS